jgi:pyruvate kinase
VRLLERAGRDVAILGDLPGPKLRIGPVAGEKILLAMETAAARRRARGPTARLA